LRTLAQRQWQTDPRVGTARAQAIFLTVAMVALAALASGCQSSSGSFLSLWRQGADSSLSKGPTKEELDDNRNLMARWLSPKKNPHSSPEALNPSPLVLGSNGYRPMQTPKNPEADAEFQAAEKLFQQGKLKEAEAGFARLAKKRKGSPWGEKGQYYLAECQYQRGLLVPAHDSFDKLIADYPGTEYLQKLVNREYAIGQAWLALSDSDSDRDPKAKPEEELPWYGRFTGLRPLLDTRGHAIQALEHVRQHDPQGPLADDALLRIADEYMGQRDYESAALYYDQLVTDHAKSPHVQRAQLAAIDARLKGYLGPEYDGTGLEQARELIKQTMSSFPDRPAGNEKLYHTLDVINDQDAERTFKVGDYYQRTGKVISAEYYFGKIRQRWPKSPWATQAKTRLAQLAKMPRKTSTPSKINITQTAGDPFASSGGVNGMNGPNGGMMNGMGMPGMGGMGGMGMPGGGMY
jgi:outer membrane protein assembly factor BamD (BamD/ComL family)